MERLNSIKEVPFIKHAKDDLYYKASRIHDEHGQFTGITKIERRPGPPGSPHVIRYAFHGAAYETLDEAWAIYKKIGRKLNNDGR